MRDIGNKLSPSIKTNIEEINLKIQQKTDKFEVIKISDVEIRGKAHKMDIYEVLKVD